jgi:hypothetical protein
MKLKILLSLLLFSLCLTVQSQTTREEVFSNISQAGGNFYIYPIPTSKLTPAPKGYKAICISHFGRHGARYLADANMFNYTIGRLQLAEQKNVITEYGKGVLQRLRKVSALVMPRLGELSKLGAEQHRGIAARMCRNFPELLSQPLNVDVKSSVVGRCVLSMANFCLQLKTFNPKLNIDIDASNHDMPYIVNCSNPLLKQNPNDAAIRAKIDAFKKRILKPQRFMAQLFTDTAFVNKEVDQNKFMYDAYKIEENMQDVPELHISLDGLLTDEEIFDEWQCENADWCFGSGAMVNTTPLYKNYHGMLAEIMNYADSVIKTGKGAVRLRFGHDGNVSPLCALLHFKGCYGAGNNIDSLYMQWSTFKVVPMACNVQIIWFRKDKSDDILVKFLRNERETSIPVVTDCAPYYHWKDVEAYYRKELSEN